MKTTIFKTALLVVLAFATSCSKDSKNEPTAAVNTYSYINGSCYDTSTNVIVPQNYCTGTTGGSIYFTQNSWGCVYTPTGMQVDPRYCNSNPFVLYGSMCMDTLTGRQESMMFCTASGATSQSRVCNGQFTYQGRTFQCGTQVNCAGYQMIDALNGQTVNCL